MLTPEQINGEEQSSIAAVFFEKTYETENGYTFAVYRAVQKYDLHPSLVPEDEDAKLLFSAHGTDLPQNDMKKVLLVGNWQIDTKKGRVSFRVNYTARAPLQDENDIIEYLRSMKCGVSEQTVNAILAAYGSESLNILKERPNEIIALFKGARRSCIEGLNLGISEDVAVEEISSALTQLGLSTEYTLPVFETLGDDALAQIRENPYVLATVGPLDFWEVDQAALKLGMQPAHRKRLCAALTCAIRDLQLDEGHVCVLLPILKSKILRMLNRETPVPVSDANVQAVLDSELKSKRMVLENGMIYRAEDYMTERNLAMVVSNLVKQPCDDELADKFERTVTRWQNNNPGIQLDVKQREAILLMSYAIAIITGGPGTGKTTVLKAIIDIYHEVMPDAHITLMAPTGRAASRMREAIGALGSTASTIHKGLDIIPYEEILKSKRIIPPGLVITDEYSMVSQALAHTQLTSMDHNREYCFLIVGDPHQLASIGPGDVLNQFIRSGVIPSVELSVVYRQGENSSIPSNCKNIVDHVDKMVFDESFTFHEALPAGSDTINQEVLETISKLYKAGVEKYGEEETVVLSPFRRFGTLAVQQLNPVLRDLKTDTYNMDSEHFFRIGSMQFRVGDKVVQTTKNNGEISNGEVGLITAISSPGNWRRKVTIDFGHCVVEYGYEEMRHIALSYSLSIHKAQGCQYDCVIIPLVMSHKRMLNNNLILTAISRASKEVHLVGEKEAFRLAVSQKPVERGTLLAEFIRQYMGLGKEERSDTDAGKQQLGVECRQLTLFERIS